MTKLESTFEGCSKLCKPLETICCHYLLGNIMYHIDTGFKAAV